MKVTPGLASPWGLRVTFILPVHLVLSCPGEIKVPGMYLSLKQLLRPHTLDQWPP